MKNRLNFLLGVCLGLVMLQAQAAMKVVACEPEWGALVQEIAADKATVYVATTAFQDPHHIEARPSLIARVRNADFLICTGSDLEAGWLPLLLTQSANRGIQPGSPGHFEAAQFVARQEIPQVLDRAQGDIHPGGNPHFHTDPRNVTKVAVALVERLAQVDTAHAVFYRGRGKTFLDRWQAAILRWEQQAASLKGIPVVVHHKEWTYLQAWLGLHEVGSLEPKPGVPPTPAHLAQLLERMQRQPARIIIRSAYNDPKASQFLSQRSGIPAVLLPYTIGGTDKATDLFGLFDDTIARLLAAVK